MKKSTIVKRILALCIIWVMIFSLVPWEDITVYAFDQSQYKVDQVTLFKIYDRNRNMEQRRVLILGSFLKDAEVGIITSSGYVALKNRTQNTDGLLQFDIDSDQLGSKLLVGSVQIDLNEEQMPNLTSASRKVKLGTESLTLTGTNFLNIKDLAAVKAKYEHDGAETSMPKDVFTSDTTASYTPTVGSLGMQNIIFEKTETSQYNFNDKYPNHPVNVVIKYTYKDQFQFYKDLVINGLTMRPNRGEKGDTVYFEAPTPGLDAYDVFFLKEINGTDPYTVNNRGTNKTFRPNVEGKDILTVQVPSLSVGEYYVVLTNATGKDPMQEVIQERIVGTAPDYEKFTIIDANIKSKIINIQPNSGPDTGSKATISGQFFGTINIPEFTRDNPTDPLGVTLTDSKEMIVEYGSGWYNKGKPGAIQVESAERRITVIIGEQASFKTPGGDPYDYSFNTDLDRLTIHTAQVADAETNPQKDVIVETVTILKYDTNKKIEIKERAELKNGYTYISSKVTPTIQTVTPDKIQVTPEGGSFRVAAKGSVTEKGKTYTGLMMAIHGTNFMIHRYVKADGTEVVRYPVIELGNQIQLDRNLDDSIYIKVLDASGNELDGTEGNEIGTKIIVVVPNDKTVSTLGKTFLRVTNPVRNSDTLGLSAQRTDFIEFVNPDANKNPIISSVKPDTVSVDGGEEVIIEGSNFLSGIKVFIDGTEVTGVNRQEDGKKITIKAPKGREGETQLLVMNPEGGTDSRPFTYVKTFTNPKITDFSPKRGNTGTLVIIKGENFLKPEPTAPEDSIYRLIGTRVLLGNIEVNEYNLDPITKKIVLRDYAASSQQDPIFRIDSTNKSLKVADYFSGLILEAEGSSPKQFYTIDVDQKGVVWLTDGASNQYRVQLNESKTAIMANKEGGSIHPLQISDNRIQIGAAGAGTFTPIVTLNFRTPYKIDDSNNIVGNRIRVTSRNEIYFRVPILEADGYYDVTVINPDTKKDSKIGQQGFYYYTQPQSKPVITEIRPNEGSAEGGYTIDILGKDFEDDGANKVKVYINGVEVSAANTTVSVGGDRITVIVPKYPGDLRADTGTNRLTVPVVVVNPDGGSASNEKGFTYVVPSSKPQITKIVPAKGTAAGGDIIEITGTDFRYYEPYDDANRNQIKDIDETFNDLNYNGQWDDLLNIQKEAGESDEAFQARKDELLGKTPTNHKQYDYYYDSPVLPKVYFGNELAKIVEFSRGYIKVITPPGASNRADVYILNNDAGISNKVPFTYESSNPKIDKVIPEEGSRLGGDKVEILGSGFAQSEMEIYTEGETNGVTNYVRVTRPLIRFTEIGNRNIAREAENGGLINNNRTTVKIAGNLTAEYNGNDKRITITVEENNKTYQKVINGYDNTVKYIPLSLMKEISTEEAYNGKELVRVEVTDRRLFVERGYAPNAEYVSPQQVRVETASYYTVGKVPVVIINPDGGKGTGGYEYKYPDSRPRIIDILKEGVPAKTEVMNGETVRVLRMTYKGGNIVTITGEDFREGATVQISDVAKITADRIDYDISSQPNTLTFEMPNVGQGALDKLHRVVVTNTDGGSAYSDGITAAQGGPIYIIFVEGQTNPRIDKVTPVEGPASGGTKVRIEGTDFRKTMEDGFEGNTLNVYFGENKVDESKMNVIDYKTIEVFVPTSQKQGVVDVKVENPDGELAILRNAFTYISEPKIEGIDPLKIFANDVNAEVTITGKMFMPGAKVIIGGKVIQEKDVKQDMQVMGTGIQGVDDDGNNIRVAVVGGKEAASVTVVNATTIKVKFNETLDLENNHLVVINPDGGISKPYDKFDYQIPVPGKPLVLEAIPGYESTMQLLWSESSPEVLNAADRYEVYAKKAADSQYIFIGDTKDASFLIKGLEPNTRYSFMVRALNKYGSAIEFAEVTARTLSEKDDDKLKEKIEQLEKEKKKLEEEGKEEVKDGVLIKTIGSKQISSGNTAYVIDFSLAKYKGQNKYVVAIPLSALQTINRQITVTDGTVSLTFLPKDLYTREVSQVSGKDIEDAYVRVGFERIGGKLEESLKGAVPRTQRQASRFYEISFELQVGKDISSIRRMMQQGTLDIKLDTAAYSTANKDKLFIGEYDPSQDKFIKLGNGSRAYPQAAGRYVLLSER
ncbi:IPT/TIG domain-containing protein [Geosporobacter ferrireducens]|uniref:Fibronectin type-III domain-containing protein n=1 Tax=Geosporobacter ferrireducens TaxID=1424294 RepID=A0A1D8GGX6_9FIRM|nr:IPT/TIG domain-containing protein [Geosporobacter ferrireducens]AOT70160.1 hypothetical protein Gferi_11490 [Geosporobacter ferrireducens]